MSILAGTAFASAQQIKVVFPLTDDNAQQVQSASFNPGSVTCRSDSDQSQITITGANGAVLATLNGTAPATFQIDKSQTLHFSGILFFLKTLICHTQYKSPSDFCQRVSSATVTCHVR